MDIDLPISCMLLLVGVGHLLQHKTVSDLPEHLTIPGLFAPILRGTKEPRVDLPPSSIHLQGSECFPDEPAALTRAYIPYGFGREGTDRL